tara:strand:- start:1229 stop:1474 length:246 start_codon:yes stop_codon:yes gene_type:complete
MSEFAMTTTESQAFSTATGGISAATFNHFILFLIGGVATIWLFLVFVGLVQNDEKSIYSAMYEFAFAVGIYITLGVIIYYT